MKGRFLPELQLHFGDRLAEAVRTKGTPLVVGLDPRWDLLPEDLRKNCNPSALREIAEAFSEFCRGVIDVVAPLVPAVKPQWAFFEQLGVAGLAALEDVIAHARKSGLLVIADAKRGDIGSTAEAYAEAFFRSVNGKTFCDALTVNPYLGADSWAPFLASAKGRGCGIFLLVKTSNAGGADLQDLRVGESRLYGIVADQVQQAAVSTQGSCGYGIVGAVVGATYPKQLAELRARMPNAWILVPGFGAQGGTARDVAPAFDDRGLGAIVNSSRAILFAHADRKYASRAASGWQSAVEAACRDAMEELRVES